MNLIKPQQGITGQAMGSGPAPQSQIEYTLRGGTGNTAMQAMRDTANDVIMKAMKKEYEKLMAMKEQGAKQIVESAVKKYGPEVKEYIAPYELFYDDNGRFMSTEFAEMAFTGVNKFKEQYPAELAAQTPGGTQEIIQAAGAKNLPPESVEGTGAYRRAAGREVADILGQEGQTQTGAYRGILGRGLETDPYKSAIGTLQEPKDAVKKELEERKLELREAEYMYRTARDQRDRDLAWAKFQLAQKKYGLAIDKAQRSFNADIASVSREIQALKKQQREVEQAYDKWVSEWGEMHPSTPEKKRIMEQRVQEIDNEIAERQQDLDNIKIEKKMAGQEPGTTRTFDRQTEKQTGEYPIQGGMPAPTPPSPAPQFDTETIKLRLRESGVPESRIDEALQEILNRAGM